MIVPLPPIPDADRKHILGHTAELWRDLAGAHFFITGGTGFYGKWLLESIVAANDQLGANARATILSRNPQRFAAEVPHLATRAEFSWIVGDTADFAFPPVTFDYVFHFATSSAAEVGAGDTPKIMQNLRGTERVLQFARACGAKRLLFASSGAIYGRQPADLAQISEDYAGSPDPTDPASAYGELKRMSELMCVTSGLDCVIARGFAFVGPYLPLTDKFAVGSFIRDALAGGPITIQGDGRAVRSYMHTADLCIWLLTVLARGTRGRAYNIGSDHGITLRELARRVAEHALRPVEVIVRGSAPSATPSSVYVPDIRRARSELGLEVRLDLTESIRRTMTWVQPTIECPA